MAVGGTCERGSLAQLAATSQCLSGKRSYAKTPGITKSDEGITVCSIVTAMCTIYPSVCAKSPLRAKLRVPTSGRLVNLTIATRPNAQASTLCVEHSGTIEKIARPLPKNGPLNQREATIFLVFLVAGCER